MKKIGYMQFSVREKVDDTDYKVTKSDVYILVIGLLAVILIMGLNLAAVNMRY